MHLTKLLQHYQRDKTYQLSVSLGLVGTTRVINRPFYSCLLSDQPFDGSKVGVDLGLIQTSLQRESISLRLFNITLCTYCSGVKKTGNVKYN